MKGGAYERRDDAEGAGGWARAQPASMKGGAYERRDLDRVAIELLTIGGPR